MTKSEDDETGHYFPAEGDRNVITSVAFWRCKCGTSVKVVTETDQANSEYADQLDARCPRCGEPQLIQGHRVMSVTANAQTNGEGGDVATS
jgi:hypothetical protein